MPEAHVILGLLFGDEGKGATTDWLTSQIQDSLVVRFSGGPQAAHAVVLPDGRDHVFAQYGSGTFNGASTFLSRFMLVAPDNMLIEREHLMGLGFDPSTYVDEDCLVVTPFHRAANRLHEVARGDGRHGSTGQGIGVCVADSLASPDPLRVKDLRDSRKTYTKLCELQQRLWVDLSDLQLPLDNPRVKKERSLFFFDQCWSMDWISTNLIPQYEAWLTTITVVDRTWLQPREGIVFEGSQGILLDEDFGFAPFHTWSKTTSANAILLANETGIHDLKVWGCTRSYATRHGAGPLPTENKLFQVEEPHNETGTYQGSWRQGNLDLDLLQLALSFDPQISGIVVNHLDAVPVDGWAVKFEDTFSLMPQQRYAADVAAALERELVLESYGPTRKHRRPVPSRGLS